MIPMRLVIRPIRPYLVGSSRESGQVGDDRGGRGRGDGDGGDDGPRFDKGDLKCEPWGRHGDMGKTYDDLGFEHCG